MLGALRNVVAAPMVISSDAAAPIFGAGITAGIGALNPFERLRRPPAVQPREEWFKSVGLPYTEAVQERSDSIELDSSEIIF